MNDCRYCGQTTKTTLMLVDRRLVDGGLPALNRFYIKHPCSIEDLCEIEVGVCCEEYACADIEHLREPLIALAKDPSLTPKTLEAIWGSFEGDAAFGEALLANPNVPIQFAREHATQYFEGILENPSLDLWLLEDPDFLRSIAREATPAFTYGMRDQWTLPCSAAWLRYLSQSEEVNERRFAASHAYLPNDCAWTLADDPDPQVRGYLSYHSKDYELLWYLAQDPDLETREIAARAGSHPSVMAHLAADQSKIVRFYVAIGDRRLHEIPSKRLSELYEEPNFEDYNEVITTEGKRDLQKRYLAEVSTKRRKARTQEHQGYEERRIERSMNTKRR
jgi:hypothetical protein